MAAHVIAFPPVKFKIIMVHFWSIVACVAFTTLLTVPAGAQGAGALQLKSNDIIELSVFGEPELNRQTRILKSGEAVFELIDSVHLAGLTLPEATKRVRDLYAADYLVDPRLNLTVIEHAIESVSVLGAVNGPGQFPIPRSGKLDLASALASAGGPAPNADLNRITLIRANGKRSNYSWAEIQNKGGIPLASGDRIVVSESRFLRKSVTIDGQVRQPGPVMFPLDGKLDLLTAISRAGGFTEMANRKKVTLIRGDRSLLLDLRAGNEQVARRTQLQPGDIITVAERLF